MPVCDDDLLDAGVELLQSLFQAADVFRHSRFPRVNQHPPTIQQFELSDFIYAVLHHGVMYYLTKEQNENMNFHSGRGSN